MRPLMFAVLSYLLCASPSLAQPVISGVSGSAGTLTLTGTGFGTHGDYGGPQRFLNAAWNDFGTAIDGGNLELDGTNNSAWSYQRSGGRTSAKPWARKDWNPATNESIRRLGSLSLKMGGTTGTYYSSFWLRCGTGIDPAAKFWRIYGANSQTVFLSIGADGNLMSASSVAGNPEPTTVWGTVTGRLRCADGWEHYEVYIRDSGGDDLIEVSIDGVRAFRRGSRLPKSHRDIEGSASNEREQWIASPWGGNGHTIDFGHMVDRGFFGISDAFVDYTRARVELSDSRTWAAARHKEIQIPLQWSDSRVVVQTNAGTFAAGQTVYAYVVHANGSVNAAGFPVVIGATR